MPITKARVRIFILLTVLSACMLVSARAFAASGDTVRVLLTRVGTTYTTLVFNADCTYSANGTQIPAGTEMKVKLGGGKVYLYAGGKGIISGSSVTVTRISDARQGIVFTSPKVSGRYLGDIAFLALDDGIAAVLTIDVEDYLYGVLPYEMSESFPPEALKAQAVCARTYAMRSKKNIGRYDLTDSTTSQVFRGYVSGNSACERAVDETRGVCLMYDGKYAGCWYTASNGGQTVRSSDVWGGYTAYTVVRDDPYDLENPKSTVRSAAIYKSALKTDKSLLSVLRSAAASKGVDREITGIVSIEGLQPKYGEPSRTYTKLRFGVTVEGKSGTLYVDIPTYDRLAGLLSLDIASTSAETVTVDEYSDRFVISFRRYGHGVGMSQRGAQQMAGEYGMKYDEILYFYFPGTVLTPSEADTEPVTEAAPANGPYVDAPAGSANVYKSRSPGSMVKGTLKNGTPLVVYGEIDGWSAVSGGGVKGYIKTVFINDGTNAVSTELAVGEAVVSAENGAPVYRYSGLTGRTAVLAKGSIVNVLGVKDDVAAIRNGSVKGYVSAGLIVNTEAEPAEPETGVSEEGTAAAETETLHEDSSDTAGYVYRSPSLTSARVGSVKDGDYIFKLAEKDGWTAVKCSGLKGYMPLDDLADRPVVVSALVDVPKGYTVRLYAAADGSSEAAGSAAGQSSIDIIDLENGWAGVIDGTVRGYIRTKYLLVK